MTCWCFAPSQPARSPQGEEVGREGEGCAGETEA